MFYIIGLIFAVVIGTEAYSSSSNELTAVVRTDWRYEAENCTEFANMTLNKYSRQELNDHFADIMRGTSRWRSCPPHNYQPLRQSATEGEWMESAWIRIFTRKIADAGDVTAVFPGGVVPLFIGWVDCHVAGNKTSDVELVQDLTNLLKPDILYVTVSQADAGIIPQRFSIHKPFHFKNIFVFSGGGYGHAPIPLLPPIQAAPETNLCGGINQKKCVYSAVFLGRKNTGPMRTKIVSALHREMSMDRSILCSAPVTNWKNILLSSKVSLCPRGFGRTSFRCFESLQMGLIPAYIFSDVPWVPYAGTPAAMSSLGVMASTWGNSIRNMIRTVKQWDAEEISRRRSAVQSVVASHYSMNGMMNQIELYVKYGPNVSDIRCSKVPPTEK